MRDFRLQNPSIPHPVMGTTKDYSRYVEALQTPDCRGIDLTYHPGA